MPNDIEGEAYVARQEAQEEQDTHVADMALDAAQDAYQDLLKHETEEMKESIQKKADHAAQCNSRLIEALDDSLTAQIRLSECLDHHTVEVPCKPALEEEYETHRGRVEQHIDRLKEMKDVYMEKINSHLTWLFNLTADKKGEARTCCHCGADVEKTFRVCQSCKRKYTADFDND